MYYKEVMLFNVTFNNISVILWEEIRYSDIVSDKEEMCCNPLNSIQFKYFIFILECTINSKLRTDLFAILANENPNFMQFSSEQKLIYLLNPTTTAHVKIIGFYIIKSLEL